MDEIERGLEWWAALSYDEKAQWLQCEAGPDEIDEELQSPDPDVRGGAAIAAVGDAWLAFKAAARTAAASRAPLRYVVMLGRDGQPPHLFDTEMKVKIMSYPTVREAERQAILLNKFICPALAP